MAIQLLIHAVLISSCSSWSSEVSLKLFWADFNQNIWKTCIISMRKNCPYSELFWSALSRIRTEYGEIRRISSYLIQMRKIKRTRITPNTDTFHALIFKFVKKNWQFFLTILKSVSLSLPKVSIWLLTGAVLYLGLLRNLAKFTRKQLP